VRASGAHDFALHADAAPVNKAQGFQAQPVRFFEVGLDDGGDLLGPHRVQVEDVSDRYAHGFFVRLHDALNSILQPGSCKA
jgi:hypothetical protein